MKLSYIRRVLNLIWLGRSCIFRVCGDVVGVLCSQNVRLKFKAFDVEYGNSGCPYDKLKVYDGHSTRDTLIGTYCGSRLPADIVSTGRALHVTFTTDRTVTKPGFHFKMYLGKTLFLVHGNRESDVNIKY